MICWAVHKLGVHEWLVLAVMTMYVDARTTVRTNMAIVKHVCISYQQLVGMHQGSGVIPLLFAIVMEMISREFRVGLPWELLYMDDPMVIANSEEEVIRKRNVRREGMEKKGLG